ncbi:MAG TPA: hypothetical protein VN645_03940 [Steroidobacteraceae bacterium]|nr:hypothetical protein [Steroidobacteraceae bacterium]
MRHPVLGLLWHNWRLSRRWYLLILAIALAANFTIMNVVPRNMANLPERRELMASGTVVLLTLLALFTTLVAISLGGRAGFPMRFEFRLPARTAVLVGVPMLMLSVLCASLYAIPMLLDRIFYGLPMPVMAGAVLVGTVAALLATASWASTTSATRVVALILAVSACARLLTWMQPFHVQNGRRTGEPAFNPDMLSLSAPQYTVLALLVLLLFGLTVYSVGLQRQGERWRPWPVLKSHRAPTAGASNNSLMDRASDLLSIPCPTSSAWAAELWLECKRLGAPLTLFGVLLALLIPVFPWVDSLLGSRVAVSLATAAPVVLFFTGIGIGIFNRRVASGGYMSAFEGTRGLGTLQLAGIQLGALGAALLLGTALIGISLWLSASRYDELGALWSRLAGLIEATRGGSIAQQAGAGATVVVGFFALMAFFFCVHSCSMFWGRKVMYGTLAFLIYAAIFAHTALTDESAGDFVAHNMWWLAGITLMLTLLLVTRVALLRLFTVKTAMLTLLAWLMGVAGATAMLQRLDLHLLTQAPELQALNAALLTLPLTLFLGTVWCYDRLRHR